MLSGKRSAPCSMTLHPPNARTTSFIQGMSSSNSEMLEVWSERAVMLCGRGDRLHGSAAAHQHGGGRALRIVLKTSAQPNGNELDVFGCEQTGGTDALPPSLRPHRWRDHRIGRLADARQSVIEFEQSPRHVVVRGHDNQ